MQGTWVEFAGITLAYLAMLLSWTIELTNLTRREKRFVTRKGSQIDQTSILCGVLVWWHCIFPSHIRGVLKFLDASYLLIVTLKLPEVHTSITISYVYTVFHHVVSRIDTCVEDCV